MTRTHQTPRDFTYSPSSPQCKPLSPLPSNTQAILRHGPSAVAYHIPSSLHHDSLPKTTISLPHHSKWTSGLHFHTAHTEYLHLLRGSIFVELNGAYKILSARAGGQVHPVTGDLVREGLVVEVPRYARHNWGRAEEYAWKREFVCPPGMTRPEDVGEDVVVEEWTDPADLGKPLFFWNLNGVVTAPANLSLATPQRLVRKVLGTWWIPFQLFVIFWDLDNWPVFVRLETENADALGRVGISIRRWGEYLMTIVVLFAAKCLGWLVGVRAVEQSRTPDALWKVYRANGV
jgi:hypothetical protein